MNGLLTETCGLLNDPSLAGFIDEAELRSASELISPRRVYTRPPCTFPSPHLLSTPNFSPSNDNFPQSQECGGAFIHQSRVPDQIFRPGNPSYCHLGPSRQVPPHIKGESPLEMGVMMHQPQQQDLPITPNRSKHSSRMPERVQASPTLASALCTTSGTCKPGHVRHISAPSACGRMPVLDDAAVTPLPIEPHPVCTPIHSPFGNPSAIENHSPIPILQPPRVPHIPKNDNEVGGMAEPAALSASLGMEIRGDHTQSTMGLSYHKPFALPPAGATDLHHGALGSASGFQQQNLQDHPGINNNGSIAQGRELAVITDNRMHSGPSGPVNLDARTYGDLSAALDTLTASLNDDGTLPFSTFEKIVQELSGIECLQSMLLFRPNKKKGKGGRQPAKDPRLDPNMCPKRAKRIVANRLSAAKSKQKQKEQIEKLQLQHDTLTIQTLLRRREKEKLEKETILLAKDVGILELEIQALSDQKANVDQFIKVLYQERDRLRVQIRMMAAAAIVSC